MNPGSGGPDRDDTGLPRVDVEVPDDARELDRDVQAYHRELRAERRERRRRRLHLTMSRDGMVMPLLVCCLVFALITGTLLTFFTSGSIDKFGLLGPQPTPAPELASAQVQVAGQVRPVSGLGPAILLIAPAGCKCDAALAELTVLAANARDNAYLVSEPGARLAASQLAIRLGHGIRLAGDNGDVLAGRGYPHTGLTAILVTAAGNVSYEQHLPNNPNDLASLFDSLAAGGFR